MLKSRFILIAIALLSLTMLNSSVAWLYAVAPREALAAPDEKPLWLLLGDSYQEIARRTVNSNKFDVNFKLYSADRYCIVWVKIEHSVKFDDGTIDTTEFPPEEKKYNLVDFNTINDTLNYSILSPNIYWEVIVSAKREGTCDANIDQRVSPIYVATPYINPAPSNTPTPTKTPPPAATSTATKTAPPSTSTATKTPTSSYQTPTPGTPYSTRTNTPPPSTPTQPPQPTSPPFQPTYTPYPTYTPLPPQPTVNLNATAKAEGTSIAAALATSNSSNLATVNAQGTVDKATAQAQSTADMATSKAQDMASATSQNMATSDSQRATAGAIRATQTAQATKDATSTAIARTPTASSNSGGGNGAGSTPSSTTTPLTGTNGSLSELPGPNMNFNFDQQGPVTGSVGINAQAPGMSNVQVGEDVPVGMTAPFVLALDRILPSDLPSTVGASCSATFVPLDYPDFLSPYGWDDNGDWASYPTSTEVVFDSPRQEPYPQMQWPVPNISPPWSAPARSSNNYSAYEYVVVALEYVALYLSYTIGFYATMLFLILRYMIDLFMAVSNYATAYQSMLANNYVSPIWFYLKFFIRIIAAIQGYITKYLLAALILVILRPGVFMFLSFIYVLGYLFAYGGIFLYNMLSGILIALCGEDSVFVRSLFGILKGILDSLNLLTWIGSILSVINKGIGLYFPALWKWLAQFWQAIYDSAGPWGLYLVTFLAALSGNSWLALSGSLLAFGMWFYNTFKNLFDAIPGMLGYSYEIAKNAPAYALDLFNVFYNGIVRSYNAWIFYIWNPLVPWLNAIFGPFFKFVSWLFNDVIFAGIKALVVGLFDLISLLITSIIEFWNAMITLFLSWLSGFINGFIYAMDVAWKAAMDFLTWAYLTAIDWLEWWWNDWVMSWVAWAVAIVISWWNWLIVDIILAYTEWYITQLILTWNEWWEWLW